MRRVNTAIFFIIRSLGGKLAIFPFNFGSDGFKNSSD